ncbi:Transposon Tf2-9 polyprotein [Cucumis melo var. makuwa]|uniref:Transposon Tf2-9 polyprotein n=1 Tax=Cucumis melo var. makuwa TaxID=1194695 RepID=A0A5A7TUV3_CUCMM|nr:Transposon Tf2-9 polyprotein [Cucumis melo var. makuwa]TYK23583.1 Transposon Tf2-9 polyprotein [Cucumis melo var. makuwa]
MMEVAQLVENREILRREANLNGFFGGKNTVQASGGNKAVTNYATGEVKGNSTFPIRTITLRSSGPNENRREGFYKRLLDAEFQARKEKGLCFRCNEKYSADHKCKMKEHRELRMFVVANDKEEFKIVEGEEVERRELNKLDVKNEDVIILIDCGATHNFVSEKLVKKLLIPIKETAHYGVILGSGAAVQGKGICEKLEVCMKNWTVEEDFLPLELGGVDVILGLQWLYSLGVTTMDWRNLLLTFSVEGKSVKIQGDLSLTKARVSLKNMIKAWGRKTKEFSLNVEREIEHQIHLKLGTNPINVRPYRYGQRKEEMEKLVKEMLESGVIKPSTSPFSSPVLLAKKKDGIVEELFDELGGAALFSKIDLKSGYHQIRMVDEDVEKKAFRAHEGHYEFLVMPFGLTNAPATFQALMNAIFKPFLRKFVLVFFDDILIYSKNAADHVEHMRKLLSILRDHELEGVEVDSEKIKSIAKWPKPMNNKEVRALLTQLLKKGGYKWNAEAENAFDRLKQAMASLSVLALPDFNQPFEIETDASGYGVGAMLIQVRRPIAYYSHTLALRDKARPMYERELMAVVLAVQQWKPYLLGGKFKVKTDQKSLKFLLEQRVIQPQYQKWIAKLLGYSFEVVYKPGVENRAADAISRMPAEVELKGLSVPVVVDLELIKKEVR